MSLLRKLGAVMACGATWLTLTAVIEPALSLVWGGLEHHFKEPVKSGEMPYYFPIIVVTPGTDGQKYQSRIIWGSRLRNYTEEHPEYSFLVPDEVRTKYRVRVRQTGEHTQYVELKASGRHSAVMAWYEATDKEIHPEYFLSSPHPMVYQLAALILAFLITVVLAIMLFRRRRIQRRADLLKFTASPFK